MFQPVPSYPENPGKEEHVAVEVSVAAIVPALSEWTALHENLNAITFYWWNIFGILFISEANDDVGFGPRP